MDCFASLAMTVSVASLAMTVNVASGRNDEPSLRDLAAGFRPSFSKSFRRSLKRGRGECRALDTPAVSRAERKQAHERSHHRSTGFAGIPAREWFYGVLRDLPGDQALLTPSPALLIADLTPASGRQNHTT
jgi:hypothetical protein